MLHSELPNQDGLKLWEQWSQKDARNIRTTGRTVKIPALSDGLMVLVVKVLGLAV